MSVRTLMAAGVAAAALLGVASAAEAAITVTQSAYYNYNADVASFPTGQIICDFAGTVATACAPSYTLAFAGTGSGLQNGTTPNVAAAPPGDTTQYAAILGPNGTATLTAAAPLGLFSFFMGSPDPFNSIAFYNGANLVQSFSGANFLGSTVNGDQTLGERIFFNLTGLGVDRVVFSSSGNAFEFDRIGIGAVPEPATWAMMILGMGMIGAGLRLRRRDEPLFA